MRKNNSGITFLIILLVLASLFFFAPNKGKSIIWVNLQKNYESHHDMEYDTDIAEFLSKNQQIYWPEDNQNRNFTNASLSYLRLVYKQNPELVETAPDLLLGNSDRPAVTNISYKSSSRGNFYDLGLEARSAICTISHNYTNLSETQIFNIAEDFASNITDCLIIHISSKKNADFVLIGTDHSLSLLTFKLVQKFEQDSKTGLFVFDEHVDIYGLEDNKNLVNKANIFGKLLLEGYVDYIVFLGVSDAAKEIIESSVSENFTRKEIFNKFNAYSDSDLRKVNWKHILNKEIRNMKKKGINKVMLSVDVDVLPIKYTGFEYSILAPAISKIRFANVNRTEQTLAEFPEGFLEGLEPDDIGIYIRFIKQSALANGIRFGTREGSVRLIGDIQELLPKQDLNFETTNATAKIAESFFKN